MSVQRTSTSETADILVVEDSLTQAQLLTYILKAHGYHVDVARHGREALNCLQQCASTMVISDIIMPEMDGYQLCRHIKRDDRLKHIPVMLLTTLDDPVEVIRGLECGADSFIVKPYDAQHLLSRVAYLLANRHIFNRQSSPTEIEITFAGQRFFITSNRLQILNLLLSTYATALQKNNELSKTQATLQKLNEELDRRVRLRTSALEAEIDQHRRTEVALRESEAKQRELFENANDMIYTLDLDGNFTSLNTMGERLSGYTRDEARVLHISHVVAPEHQDLISALRVCQRHGSDNTSCAVDIVAKDGHRVGLEVNSRLIYQYGNVVGVQGIARDISERKYLEQQLQQSQKMEAIGRLAGGVAHDFNNLLTVITGYSDFLMERFHDLEPVYKGIDVIKQAAERASALTRQLLAFSRKQVLQPRILNLNVVITKSAEILRRLIGEDIELDTVLDPALGNVYADPAQIEQVIMNLAVNARDAMPLGGRFILETATVDLDESSCRRVSLKAGSYVLLSVRDTGCGMDTATMAHIFEPFFTTKVLGEGTGLGLSTVYGIVQQSRGQVLVDSELGVGTTFKIYLPQFLKPVVLDDTGTSDNAALPRGSETVLLVEDEDMVRKLTCDLLGMQGYNVLVASNAGEALQLCEAYTEAIHIVLADVVMPQISGPELMKHLARLRPGLRTLYMSGYTADAIVRHGLPDTKARFLQKPFTLDTLANKVREVLDEAIA